MDNAFRTAVANAASQYDALIAIAEGIDVLLDKLDALDVHGDAAEPWPGRDWRGDEVVPEDGDVGDLTTSHGAIKPVAKKAGEVIYEVMPVSDELQRQRYELATRMNLDKTLGTGDGTLTGAYVKGGPEWLYLGNREFVMQMSREMRREMVTDVESRDPEFAHKMGRDVLKYNMEDADRGVPKEKEVL